MGMVKHAFLEVVDAVAEHLEEAQAARGQDVFEDEIHCKLRKEIFHSPFAFGKKYMKLIPEKHRCFFTALSGGC
jgi:hypothetical protein